MIEEIKSIKLLTKKQKKSLQFKELLINNLTRNNLPKTLYLNSNGEIVVDKFINEAYKDLLYAFYGLY